MMFCMQFTWFKCGGLSLGLSWSHVLGDAFSAFSFITKWSQILAGHAPPKILPMSPTLKEIQTPHNNNSVNANNGNHFSVKTATTIEELWLATNGIKMVTHTFHVTAKQLNRLVSSTFFSCDQNKATKTSSLPILHLVLKIPALCHQLIKIRNLHIINRLLDLQPKPILKLST